MARTKNGRKKLLNRAPRWVIEGLEALAKDPPSEPCGTEWFIHFTYEWRNLHLSDYAELRWPPRDWDNTPNEMAALLRRMGWTNLKAGTGRPAMWERS
jgi:hypothetical protein